MPYQCIHYEKEAPIAIVTLNRPEVLNAMNRQLWLEFDMVLDEVAVDPDVMLLVITGAGRAFSTGADLKDSKSRSLDDYRRYLETLQETSRKLLRFEKPTIAAINGYALGSGYELALACDLRIAAEDAKIGSPEASVTSSVTGGAMRLLQDLVGPGKAKELLFTAERITGTEALRIGLVNQTAPADQLMEKTLALAEKIVRNSAFSIKMMKKGLRMASGDISLEALMDFEVEACLACVSTKERQTSLTAFENRKKPSEKKRGKNEP